MTRTDLTGKVFGRWTVIAYDGQRIPGIPTSGTTWKCRCSCGTEKGRILYNSLKSGRSQSCGCLRRTATPKPPKQPKPPTLTSICREHNVRYLNVRQRITRGETLQQAIEWCLSRGLTFFERALSHGSGGPGARLTKDRRISQKPFAS